MPIAITDDHQELASTVRGVLAAHKALQAARALLEVDRGAPSLLLARDGRPRLARDSSARGVRRIGAGLVELVVVLDELGRQVAPGPFLPTVLASAVIEQCGSAEQKQRWLPGLADGSRTGALGLGTPDLALGAGRLDGDAGVVLGGSAADVILVRVSDDVVIVPADALGLTLQGAPDLDPTRRSLRASASGVSVDADHVIAGAAPGPWPWPAPSAPLKPSGSPRPVSTSRSSTPSNGCSSVGPSVPSRP